MDILNIIYAIGRFIRNIFIIIITCAAIGAGTVYLFGRTFLDYVQGDLMLSDAVVVDLGAMPVNLSSTIYYQDPETGEFVEWYTLANTENRLWVDDENIPKLVKNAFIAIEDERFLEHHGVDWKRTAAASLYSVTGKTVFGGSTITQQLIKNLTGDKQVTVKRKLTEICRALKMEETYSKNEILEWYMNVIYFGRGQYGIGAAARHYFGKEVGELSLAEICSIVGITNNPSKYDPYNYPSNNKSRQEIILKKMLDLGYIKQAAYNEAVKEELSFSGHTEEQEMGTEAYPYYVDAVVEDVIDYFQTSTGITREQATTMLYYGGYNIYACVDMNIQKKMDSVYQNVDNIPVTRDKKPLQSSMVVIDPSNGNIVGLEGGVGEKTVARGLNWATSSLGRRPPGSSIKPIAVYGPALDREIISPNTLYLDSPDIVLNGTDWFPMNDSRKNYGVVTIRYGVVHSLNTIAAQVMDKLTPAVSYKFLTETLHMNLEKADQDYAPLAAGQLSIGTTTREMASAYTIFPNLGTYIQGRTFSHIYDNEWELVYENISVAEKAVSAKAAYWMTDILKEAVSSGTGKEARLSGMPTAGKTGTTSDKKDRWFVGYTPYYVGAVWTGYSKPGRINISGNPAAMLWKNVMTLIHEDLDYKNFPVPADTSFPDVKNVLPEIVPKPGDDNPDNPENPENPENPGNPENPDYTYEFGPGNAGIPEIPIPPVIEIPPAPVENPSVEYEGGENVGAPTLEQPPAENNQGGETPDPFDVTPPDWLRTP